MTDTSSSSPLPSVPKTKILFVHDLTNSSQWVQDADDDGYENHIRISQMMEKTHNMIKENCSFQTYAGYDVEAIIGTNINREKSSVVILWHPHHQRRHHHQYRYQFHEEHRYAMPNQQCSYIANLLWNKYPTLLPNRLYEFLLEAGFQ